MPGVLEGAGRRPRRPGAARSGPSPWRTRSPRCRRWRPGRANECAITPSPCPSLALAPCAEPSGRSDHDGARDVVAQVVGAADRDGHDAGRPVVGQRALLGDRPGQRHGAVGVVRRAQADVDLGQTAARPGPVGDVAAHQPVGGQDVHEDVLGAPRLGQHRVVVHVLVVAAGDGARHDQRAGDREHQRRQLVAHGHVGEGRPGGQRRRRGRRAVPRRRRRRPGQRLLGDVRPELGQLQRSGRRAAARSACPRGSSGGSGR